MSVIPAQRKPGTRSTSIVGVILCLAVGLAACREAEPPGAAIEEPELTRAPHHEDILVPSDNDGPALPPEQLLGPVLEDAAHRAGLAIEELLVSRAARVTWSDGSLGCPQPGMSYTQALVPGWHVHVTAGDEILDYRLTDRGSFLLCRGGDPGGGLISDER